jgi:hypothetical protein
MISFYIFVFNLIAHPKVNMVAMHKHICWWPFRMREITTLVLIILWTFCKAQDNDKLSHKIDKMNFLYLNPLPFFNYTFQITAVLNLEKIVL